MKEEGRGKMEEFYDGRCKREEGRNSNATTIPTPLLLFNFFT